MPEPSDKPVEEKTERVVIPAKKRTIVSKEKPFVADPIFRTAKEATIGGRLLGSGCVEHPEETEDIIHQQEM